MDITLHCALAACPVEKSHFRAFFRLTTKLRILKIRLIHMLCYNATFEEGPAFTLEVKNDYFYNNAAPYSISLFGKSWQILLTVKLRAGARLC